MKTKLTFLAALAALVSVGCASAGKALVVACDGCALLQSTGACAAVVPQPEALPRAARPALPSCEAPKQLWVINFKNVMDKHEKPIFECR